MSALSADERRGYAGSGDADDGRGHANEARGYAGRVRAVTAAGLRGSAARLRGWGGVAAMALACVLTAAFALLPLPRVSEEPAHPAGGQGLAEAVPAVAPGAAGCIEDEPDRSLPPSQEEGAKIEEIKTRTDKPRKLIVGIDQNSYLWGFRDPNTGRLAGFDIDLANRIAEQIFGRDENGKINIIFRAVPTNQRIPMIKSGQVDMIVRTMTISCKRKNDVAFSTAYFKTGQQVLAPETSDIDGFDKKSLAGKRLCVASGSTAQDALEASDFGADKPLEVPNQLDCLVRLQLGEVDGLITDSALAAGQAAQDPTVELKGDAPFTEEFYGIAMSKDAQDLVRRVNYELEQWRKDTTAGWQASYDKWLEPRMGAAKPPSARYIEP